MISHKNVFQSYYVNVVLIFTSGFVKKTGNEERGVFKKKIASSELNSNRKKNNHL